MITEQEIQYIKNTWCEHKYLHPVFWGESFTKANPETYLAMYRGGLFVRKEGTLHVSENDYVVTKDFVIQVLNDWCSFLQFTNIKTYNTDIKHMKEHVRKYIYTMLCKNTFLENERIYCL